MIPNETVEAVMDSKRVTPDGAVEAVAKAVYSGFPAMNPNGSVARWDQLDDSPSGRNRKALELAKAKIALETSWRDFK